MRIISLIIINLCWLCLAVFGDTEIRCQQDISIIGKTEGQHSILFYYSDWKSSSRCGSEALFILFLSPDGTQVFNRRYFRGNWAGNYLKDLHADSSILVRDSSGKYYLNDSVYFEPPPADSSFPDSFWKLPRCDAVTWNWEHRSRDGYDSPIIHGADWNLVYRHNEGVYKNYMIREVYYYPNSNYVVIKTLQPQLDGTNKTMDGLMIFYLK